MDTVPLSPRALQLPSAALQGSHSLLLDLGPPQPGLC